MQYRQDWIMRQIEMLTAFFARAIFGKERAFYVVRDEAHLSRGDLMHRRLLALLARGALCEAEDLLFEELDGQEGAGLAVAIDFYHRLNALDDAALGRGNFSRAEIADGLRDALGRHGLEALWPEA